MLIILPLHVYSTSIALPSTDPSKPGRGPDLKGQWPGVICDACYEGQQRLAFWCWPSQQERCLNVSWWFWGAMGKLAWLWRGKCRSRGDLGWQAANLQGRRQGDAGRSQDERASRRMGAQGYGVRPEVQSRQVRLASMQMASHGKGSAQWGWGRMGWWFDMLNEKAKKSILEGIVLSHRKGGRKTYKRCPHSIQQRSS